MATTKCRDHLHLRFAEERIPDLFLITTHTFYFSYFMYRLLDGFMGED